MISLVTVDNIYVMNCMWWRQLCVKATACSVVPWHSYQFMLKCVWLIKNRFWIWWYAILFWFNCNKCSRSFPYKLLIRRAKDTTGSVGLWAIRYSWVVLKAMLKTIEYDTNYTQLEWYKHMTCMCMHTQSRHKTHVASNHAYIYM